MDSELDINPNLRRFLEGKAALKRELISLSYPEKIQRVIKMQELERLLKRDKNKKVYVWRFD